MFKFISRGVPEVSLEKSHISFTRLYSSLKKSMKHKCPLVWDLEQPAFHMKQLLNSSSKPPYCIYAQIFEFYNLIFGYFVFVLLNAVPWGQIWVQLFPVPVDFT